MILSTRAGDVELRSSSGMFQGIDSIPTPAVGVGMGTGSWTASGRRVSPESAAGLPAVLRGIRVLAETAAAMPLKVIEATSDNERREAVEVWQWELLHDVPNDTQRTPFAFKEFLVASIVARGNGYALKAKSRGRVQALYPIRPSRVTPRYSKDGEHLEYEVRSASGQVKILTSEDLLHIPGMLYADPCVGTSPITMAAAAVGTALGAEEFAGRFFDNDATPGGVLEFPGSGDSQAAKDTRETWNDRHRSSRRAHKTAALFGGAKYVQIGVDAQAAQIIESQRWSVEQAARAVGLPAWVLGGTDQNPRSTPEQRNSELLTFSVMPWLKRVEEGLHADTDLFPDKALFPFFDSAHLVSAEMALRYAAYLQARHGGWLSANDIRRKENEPPIEGGDEYQMVPVGGTPDLQPGAGDTTSPDAPADPTA